MKAVDTNVLVRYLVQDDPRQGKRAADFIEAAATGEEQILIGNIVLCEMVWVLESAYGYSKPEIADAIEKILQAGAFRFESKDIGSRGARGVPGVKGRFCGLPDRKDSPGAGLRDDGDLRHCPSEAANIPIVLRRAQHPGALRGRENEDSQQFASS